MGGSPRNGSAFQRPSQTRPSGGRDGERNPFFNHRRLTQVSQQAVDPVPKENRFPIGDEKRAPGGRPGTRGHAEGGAFAERPPGEERGTGGIYDPNQIDAIAPTTHDAQPPGAGAGEQTGDEMRIADPQIKWGRRTTVRKAGGWRQARPARPPPW